MRTKFFLTLIIFSVFAVSRAGAQIGGRCTVSWINQVVVDKENGNDIENYVAVFSKAEDSLIVYKWSVKDGEKPQRITFWGEKDQTSDVVRFRSTDGADIKVAFLKENKIRIDSDLYMVNKPYYDFLRQKIGIEKSILDLAFFVKEGYGDYAVDLELLIQKNWRNQKETPGYKIIEVKVKNKNEQTDDQFHNWKAVYRYHLNGELQSITGEHYTKKWVSSKGLFIKYLVEQNLDRSYSRGAVYQNKKTLMDSVSVNWTQLSTAKEFHYSKYQSKIKLVQVAQKPEDFSEISKLLRIKHK